MGDRDVAQSYAQTFGFGFLAKGTLPVRSPSLGGDLRCVNAISGRIAGLAQGLVFESVGGGAPGAYANGRGMPAAQFEIAGLSDAVEGLWVRRSGRGFWTRAKLPRRYTEVTLANEALMSRYRVAARADRDERFARLLLGDTFAGWLLERAPQEEGFLSIGTSFELWRGVVFIRGPRDAFQSLEKLTVFAAAAAQIADCVRTVVNALQQDPSRPSPLDGDAEAHVKLVPQVPRAGSPASESKSIDRAAYGVVADKIEAELRTFGAWELPAPDGPVRGAFGAPDRSFAQWLHYDLLPRLREIAAGRADPPDESMAGSKALREFDGLHDADPLIDVLLELDRLVEGR